MAPSQSKAKTEKLWRDAWCGSPYTGVVALPEDETKETMVIQCEDVKAEYGVDAEILDDGRHVGIGIGNRVAFGIVARGEDESPIAVNIYRVKPKKKKSETQDAAFDFSAWAEEEPETSKRPPPQKRVSLSKTMRGDLVGIVRNQSFTSGNFFVECEEVYDEFQCDVMVRLHDMPRGAGLGDAIVFQIKPPIGDAFTCVHVIPGVRKATGELSEAVLARGFRDGRRCFNCGGLHLIRDCPERKGGKGGKKGTSKGHGYKPETMRMIGIVKKRGQTGRHFILCQDISDVYGKDAQIPVDEIPDGLKIGDRISFDVDEPPEGHHAPPLARNVKVLSDTPGSARKTCEPQGDGEDDEGGGVEELDDGDGEPEADDAYLEGGDDDAEVDGDEEEAGEEAQDEAGDEDDQVPEPSAKRPRISEEPMEGEPETLAGWKVSQDRLFGHLKTLPAGWIRIRSKSTGKLYFYNTFSGESTTSEPS